jgi:succinate-semialdehyde dehydrogenase/glutarate-semialdehyde dehydrogenase
MAIQSINPYSGEVLAEYTVLTEEILYKKLRASHRGYEKWRKTTFDERKELMISIADILESQKVKYGRVISLEMGKPITQAVAEIEKCALLCRYYAKNAEKFLKTQTCKSDYSQSMITYEPIGIIYAIMPWNYPFWQLFRCAVPAIMAGNTVVLKHALNVPMSAHSIEDIFKHAEAPKGVFNNLFIEHEQSELVVAFDGVRGISLTGSDRAGKAVASQAGAHIKRTVLELGGSDPYIVLDDADIEKAVKTGVTARMQNAGQSCIAAKRFILHKDIAREFIHQYVEQVKALKVGDPLNEKTDMGPMARKDLRDNVAEQVEKTVSMGARILTGGQPMPGKGFFYEPTVLVDVPFDSPGAREEVFGPVASMFIVDNEDDALKLANDTVFGLGASLWTKDINKAMQLSKDIQSGNVYINAMVKSDQRLPFGGVKKSGYGRELSEVGIHEFVNTKTIAIGS